MGVPLAMLGLEICRLIYKFSLTYVNVHQELTLSSVFILIWIKMRCVIDHYKLRYRRRRTCCCFLFLLTKEMIRIKRSPKQFLVKFNRSSFLSLVLRKETDVMLFLFLFFLRLCISKITNCSRFSRSKSQALFTVIRSMADALPTQKRPTYVLY